MSSISREDQDLIIKTYYEGGVMIPYEEIKAYNPIRKFVHKGLFFYYEITDPDCFFEVMLMPTYDCERIVKAWEQQRKNVSKIVGKKADFMISDEIDYLRPKQRLEPHYIKLKQRK